MTNGIFKTLIKTRIAESIYMHWLESAWRNSIQAKAAKHVSTEQYKRIRQYQTIAYLVKSTNLV